MAVHKTFLGLQVQFGGIEHNGWLPPGAARPLPTPIEHAVLDLEIMSNGQVDCLLCWRSRDGRHSGDDWYPTLADALEGARRKFGIHPDAWGES